MYSRLSKTVISLASIVILVCLPKDSIASQDLTEDANASGSNVVRATIARLDYVFRNSMFWDISHSTFIRTLAYVESEDGGSIMSGNIQEYRGIWRISYQHFFSALRYIMADSELNNIIAMITNEIGDITDDDNLYKPVYSALAARLILIERSMRGPSLCDLASLNTIYNNISNLAQFWLTCYRRGMGRGASMDHFITKSQELQQLSGNDCTVGTDLAFVLDSSGSIEEDNWELVKDYVRAVTAAVGVEGDQRVAIITYADFAVLNSPFIRSGTQLTSIIDGLPFLGTYTNTADGLCQLLRLQWRENVLRMAIVMTDGESNRESNECGDTLAAVAAVYNGTTPPLRLTVSVIGVKDNVNEEELEAIASSSSLIYRLDDLQETLALKNIIEQQAYQICFTASPIVEVGSDVAGEDFTTEDTARYSYTYQEEGVTIRLCVQNGRVILYASLTIPNPNAAFNDFALDAVLHGDICEDVFVDPSSMVPDVDQNGRRKRQVSSSEGTLFVSIEGIAESSTFTLETTVGDTANYTVTCAQAICGRNSNCTDDPVGYSCVCLPGYVFGPDLIDCHDINECERFPSPCSQFANCTNTNGSYECSCQPTHIGDGVTCKLNENSELKFILIIACSAGGGVIVLVVVLAAVISICKTMTASKNSPYHERGNNPAPSNLNADNKDPDTVHLTENMLY